MGNFGSAAFLATGSPTSHPRLLPAISSRFDKQCCGLGGVNFGHFILEAAMATRIHAVSLFADSIDVTEDAR